MNLSRKEIFAIASGAKAANDKTKKHSPVKKAIAVICNMSDGIITPLSFIWHNGIEYDVKEVLSRGAGCSVHHGVLGQCYKCRVGKSIVYLTTDGKKWYLEYEHEREAAEQRNAFIREHAYWL